MSRLPSENEFRSAKPICERLLLCLLPSESERRATVAAGEDVRRKAGIWEPIRASVLHATVAVLADASAFPASTVSRYEAAGEGVARKAGGPFRLEFSRASRNGLGVRPQPLVLVPEKTPPQFKAMQKAVLAALAEFGLPPPRHGMSGAHTTLLYGHGGVDMSIPPVRWQARELALVLSLVGISRHIVIATWPLTTAPDLFDEALLRI